jgi:GNAT superfamily N-acetyltransferase
MPIEVEAFAGEHLEGAALMVSRRYRALRQRIATLPPKYEQVGVLQPLLQQVLETAPGVVATRGRHLVGFLGAWLIPSFRGDPAAYSPEWANAADGPDVARVYEAMYAHLSAIWVESDHRTHMVSLLADDGRAANTLHWLGFGMAAVDALRNLRPTRVLAPEVTIRRAGPKDTGVVEALEDALNNYLADAPIFLPDQTPHERESSSRRLGDSDRSVWLAEGETETLGFLAAGPASDDASTIIHDPGTASISGAFTRIEARGKGIASALLDRVLGWARAQGYERCAVDFESMNPLAARFWLRHFEPVCWTLLRQI